jgi:hypothetical protein
MPLSLEAGVWKIPFVLTAGGSTPQGNGMTFDRLRHQLIISNNWLRTLFIRHYPPIWRLLKVMDIEMTHTTPVPLYCPVCFCWVIGNR